jgi:hypothetical protein
MSLFDRLVHIRNNYIQDLYDSNFTLEPSFWNNSWTPSFYFSEEDNPHYYRDSPFKRIYINKNEEPKQFKSSITIPIHFYDEADKTNVKIEHPKPERINTPKSVLIENDNTQKNNYELDDNGEIDLTKLNLPEDIEQQKEIERMYERMELYSLAEKTKIKGDGNCQFSAAADQLFNDPNKYHEVRRLVVKWLRNNPNFKIDSETQLIDFLEKDIYNSWEEYCDNMSKNGQWGDQITLYAISQLFNARIVILSSVKVYNGQSLITIEPRNKPSDTKIKTLLIGHWHERHFISLKFSNT